MAHAGRAQPKPPLGAPSAISSPPNCAFSPAFSSCTPRAANEEVSNGVPSPAAHSPHDGSGRFCVQPGGKRVRALRGRSPLRSRTGRNGRSRPGCPRREEGEYAPYLNATSNAATAGPRPFPRGDCCHLPATQRLHSNEIRLVISRDHPVGGRGLRYRQVTHGASVRLPSCALASQPSVTPWVLGIEAAISSYARRRRRRRREDARIAQTVDGRRARRHAGRSLVSRESSALGRRRARGGGGVRARLRRPPKRKTRRRARDASPRRAFASTALPRRAFVSRAGLVLGAAFALSGCARLFAGAAVAASCAAGARRVPRAASRSGAADGRRLFARAIARAGDGVGDDGPALLPRARGPPACGHTGHCIANGVGAFAAATTV